jgi:hypothetical protein
MRSSEIATPVLASSVLGRHGSGGCGLISRMSSTEDRNSHSAHDIAPTAEPIQARFGESP